MRLRRSRGAAATVTGNVHDAVRDCVSVAVHSTVVLPIGNSALAFGVQLTVMGCAPPSAEGESKLTVAGPLKGAVIAIGDGHDRESGGAATGSGPEASIPLLGELGVLHSSQKATVSTKLHSQTARLRIFPSNANQRPPAFFPILMASNPGSPQFITNTLKPCFMRISMSFGVAG